MIKLKLTLTRQLVLLLTSLINDFSTIPLAAAPLIEVDVSICKSQDPMDKK